MKKRILLIALFVSVVFAPMSVQAKHYANMDEMIEDLRPVVLESMENKDQIEKDFKEEDYELIPYSDIMRKREGEVNVKHTFYATVQQYDEAGNLANGLLMRDDDLDQAYYMLVPNLPENRLMKDDNVDVYGRLYGLYTYETVMGGSKTVPLIVVDKILLEGVDY